MNQLKQTFLGLENILKANYFELLLDFYEVYLTASSVKSLSEKSFLMQFIKFSTKKDTDKCLFASLLDVHKIVFLALIYWGILASFYLPKQNLLNSSSINESPISSPKISPSENQAFLISISTISTSIPN